MTNRFSLICQFRLLNSGDASLRAVSGKERAGPWWTGSAMDTRQDTAHRVVHYFLSCTRLYMLHAFWQQSPWLSLLTLLFVTIARCLLALKPFHFIFRPQYGGKFCPGSSRMYQLCNINPCNENSLDFRAQQCAEYNSKPFRGWFYQWKPYTKVEGNLVSVPPTNRALWGQ